jgi:hypothetical protein
MPHEHAPEMMSTPSARAGNSQTLEADPKKSLREQPGRTLRVCSYEDRAEAMDSLILMAESLCRVDPSVSLNLTVPAAPASVRAWAKGRPEVVISSSPPDGTKGWDVKPCLLLRELDAGWPEALWLDDDMIVSQPLSALLTEFPRDALIVTEEWNDPEVMPVCPFWELPSVRPIRPFNACLVRATQAHRPLLKRWLELIRDPRYQHAQTLPFDARPLPVASDGWLLTALLECAEFADLPFAYLRLGRHIAQCAGSSGYRPADRVAALFRGLPPLIHCIGRKPWVSWNHRGRLYSYLVDLATDVSPYVLASRRVARNLGLKPEWIQARTAAGAVLRGLTAYHPVLAGLPMSILHAIHVRINHGLNLLKRKGT